MLTSERAWGGCSPASTAAIVGGGFAASKELELRERLRRPPDPPPADAAVGSRAAIGATCWTLARLRAALGWLGGYGLSGIWRLLRRLRIRLRRGRPRQFSPDPAYLAKERGLLDVLRQVATSDGRLVVVFLDECTYYHWPLPAPDWAPLGAPPPLAERAAPGERRGRVVAALDGHSGRVRYQQANTIGRVPFGAFLGTVAAAYPRAERVYVVLDNRPVHHHPEVGAAVAALGRLELVFLPTYAPWLNPIEKLWDWLKEAELRMHRRAGHWKDLQQRVGAFLAAFDQGSRDLLQRVGLLGDGKLAAALHPPITDFDGQT
jgi:hypothetical protein